MQAGDLLIAIGTAPGFVSAGVVYNTNAQHHAAFGGGPQFPKGTIIVTFGGEGVRGKGYSSKTCQSMRYRQVQPCTKLRKCYC